MEQVLKDLRAIKTSEMYADDSAIRDRIYRVSGVIISPEAPEAFAQRKLPIEIRDPGLRQEVLDLVTKIGEDRFDELQEEVNDLMFFGWRRRSQ